MEPIIQDLAVFLLGSGAGAGTTLIYIRKKTKDQREEAKELVESLGENFDDT